MPQRYRVLRAHIGDRPYSEGDVRRAEPSTVAHLVAAGALKAEAPLNNQAEGASPQNKAEGASPRNKRHRRAGEDA